MYHCDKKLPTAIFEVELQPGERKEVALPIKGPIVHLYLFEDKCAEEYFKNHGLQAYLNSKYGRELGLQKIVYDAENKKKLAEEVLFPDRKGKKRQYSPERVQAGPSTIPLSSFVGEGSGLQEPLLATGADRV